MIDHELRIMLEKGSRRLQVLGEVANADPRKPLGSDLIARNLEMEQSNVIRILNELERKEAIKCVTGRKRDRLFLVTRKGKILLNLLGVKIKSE